MLAVLGNKKAGNSTYVTYEINIANGGTYSLALGYQNVI